MGLSRTQLAMIQKARTAGGTELAVSLSDEACSYLAAVIARDLDLLHEFPELPRDFAPFFTAGDPTALTLPGLDFERLIDRLVELRQDSDTYFVCLANLHKRRIKYHRILQRQAIPTIDQVGPRGLLEFGKLSPTALVAWLFWRKWFYDIDNRAAQETGYLFEPIVAHAIGGVAYSAKASPIRRSRDPSKGRQVDCTRGRRAYEFKIRLTIASSGQGRWQEELDFPEDCRQSGYRPVLIVLDPTPNEKLAALEQAFKRARGEVYTGDRAWQHLERAAGDTMATFLERYVRAPLADLLRSVAPHLPDFSARCTADRILVTIGGESITIERSGPPIEATASELPDDAADQVPGP